MLGGPKKCAKCEKLVYPLEELKCLEKIWHKNCFKCTVCNSLLNMKNYKGFDKLPYCYVHYPQQKHTAVSDNPELQRMKENTKIQSNAKYHEDFEKTKGNYTVVADDPETRRVLENTKIISQVKYHEDFEKIKNKYTPVLDNPETTRAIENQKIVSSVEYKGIKNNQNHANNGTSHTNGNNPMITTYKAGEKKLEPQSQRRIGSIADYDPLNNENHNNNNLIINRQYQSDFSSNQAQKFSPTNNYVKTNSVSNTNGHSHVTNNGHNGNSNGNGHYRSSNNQYYDTNNNNGTDYDHHSQQYQYSHFNNNNNNHLIHNMHGNDLINNEIATTVYRAIYDYDAKEDDEISFRDGDKFINCEQIDVGWMIGVHEKTGKHGMFPSNYAEPIDLF